MDAPWIHWHAPGVWIQSRGRSHPSSNDRNQVSATKFGCSEQRQDVHNLQGMGKNRTTESSHFHHNQTDLTPLKEDCKKAAAFSSGLGIVMSHANNLEYPSATYIAALSYLSVTQCHQYYQENYPVQQVTFSKSPLSYYAVPQTTQLADDLGVATAQGNSFDYRFTSYYCQPSYMADPTSQYQSYYENSSFQPPLPYYYQPLFYNAVPQIDHLLTGVGDAATKGSFDNTFTSYFNQPLYMADATSQYKNCYETCSFQPPLPYYHHPLPYNDVPHIDQLLTSLGVSTAQGSCWIHSDTTYCSEPSSMAHPGTTHQEDFEENYSVHTATFNKTQSPDMLLPAVREASKIFNPNKRSLKIENWKKNKVEDSMREEEEEETVVYRWVNEDELDTYHDENQESEGSKHQSEDRTSPFHCFCQDLPLEELKELDELSELQKKMNGCSSERLLYHCIDSSCKLCFQAIHHEATSFDNSDALNCSTQDIKRNETDDPVCNDCVLDSTVKGNNFFITPNPPVINSAGNWNSFRMEMQKSVLMKLNTDQAMPARREIDASERLPWKAQHKFFSGILSPSESPSTGEDPKGNWSNFQYPKYESEDDSFYMCIPNIMLIPGGINICRLHFVYEDVMLLLDAPTFTSSGRLLDNPDDSLQNAASESCVTNTKHFPMADHEGNCNSMIEMHSNSSQVKTLAQCNNSSKLALKNPHDMGVCPDLIRTASSNMGKGQPLDDVTRKNDQCREAVRYWYDTTSRNFSNMKSQWCKGYTELNQISSIKITGQDDLEKRYARATCTITRCETQIIQNDAQKSRRIAHCKNVLSSAVACCYQASSVLLCSYISHSVSTECMEINSLRCY